jgi:hypothetical protein
MHNCQSHASLFPLCLDGGDVVPGSYRRTHFGPLLPCAAATKPGADREGARTVLCDDDPVFVLYRIAQRYGLPALPEWAQWFKREPNQRKSIVPLQGLGCLPVLVRGNKQTFLKWIGRALRERLIRIPEQSGPISWKWPTTFLEQSKLEPTSEERSQDAEVVSV